MNRVLREEKKYVLNIAEAMKLRNRLDEVLIPDSHNGLEGYVVRSLYFDTIGDDDYFNKMDGLELRRKLRLRTYGPGSDFAKLEIKQKQGDNQLKRSLDMPREDAEEIVRGNYDVLLKYSEDFAAECFALFNMHCYRPKTIVDYKRYAFIAKENRIRITFDSSIRATESSFDMFDDSLLMNPVDDPFRQVLEVKYNGFLLSYIKDLLRTVDKSVTSVSKYVLARQQGYSTRF